ncbi:MAG: hypothetical protein GX538_04355 [Gammaproteobacteria bacterium]|nr:hypothetical protein [Gammaproteobacteria bacterium]
MHDHPVDLSEVRFRNPEVRHIPRREDEAGTPFWRIVGAVFVALCLYGLLQTVVTVALVRHAVKDLERQFHALLSSPDAAAAAPAPVPARPTAARPAAARLPVHPGPVEARKAGFPQACIGGFVSNRVEGGWSQTRQRCTAASE